MVSTFIMAQSKGTPWKWLNLQKYFELLRQDDDIQYIKYFTALVEGTHKPNQETYLLAIETLPKVKIILGKFKQKTVRCRVKECDFGGTRFFQTMEEKHTDVNIALHMLHDSVFNECDRLVLVSGDSDLAPAVSMVKNLNPQKEVIVYIPANDPIRGAAVGLRSLADKHGTLPNNLFRHAQFPHSILDNKGRWISKPITW